MRVSMNSASGRGQSKDRRSSNQLRTRDMGGWLSKKGGTAGDGGGKGGVVKLRREIKNPFVLTRTR